MRGLRLRVLHLWVQKPGPRGNLVLQSPHAHIFRSAEEVEAEVRFLASTGKWFAVEMTVYDDRSVFEQLADPVSIEDVDLVCEGEDDG